MDRFWMALAWMLPRRLVYWCTIRATAEYTVKKEPTAVVPEVRAMDVISTW